MGKSGNGPDMQDCSAYIAEMSRARPCSISVLLEPDGSVGGCGWRGFVLAAVGASVVAKDAPCVSVSFRFPHRSAKTFEGALFNALVQADALLAREEFIALTRPAG